MTIMVAVLLLVGLAIAAPIFGYDSRIVDADRRVRWWPGERRSDLVLRRDAYDRRPRARPQHARSAVADTKAA